MDLKERAMEPAEQLVISDLETVKVLAEPLRLRIVQLLRGEPRTHRIPDGTGWRLNLATGNPHRRCRVRDFSAASLRANV